MSNTPPSTRRLGVATTAAVASTTIAIAVTAGSLLGWLRPAATPAIEATPAPPIEPTQPAVPTPAPGPVIFVPITPATPPAVAPAPDPPAERAPSRGDVQLAIHDRHDDDHDRDDHDDADDEDDDD